MPIENQTTEDAEAECRVMARLLTRAADDLAYMRQQKECAEISHQMQQRNTAAFHREKKILADAMKRIRDIQCGPDRGTPSGLLVVVEQIASEALKNAKA